jgi:hypothetical protein
LKATKQDVEESDDDERPKKKIQKLKPGLIECIAIRIKVQDEMHPNVHLNNRLDKVSLYDIIEQPEGKKLSKGDRVQVMINDFPTDAEIDNAYVFTIDAKQVNTISVVFFMNHI